MKISRDILKKFVFLFLPRSVLLSLPLWKFSSPNADFSKFHVLLDEGLSHVGFDPGPERLERQRDELLVRWLGPVHLRIAPHALLLQN